MKPALLVLTLLLTACRAPEDRPPRKLASLDLPPAAAPVLSRTTAMAKMPCTRCHTVPLPRMSPTHPAAHWDITLRHAPKETMTCQTCHPDPAEGQLRLLEGAPAGFDEAYRLCGQCHARQLTDWRGGAHGKRATGWAAARVATNCTGCHNPHAPAFAKRMPAIIPKESPHP